MDSSISYASLSTLPPETNYIQIVNYIMYFCWVNKTLELELELLQWMLVHRDPKRAAIAPLTKGRPWTDFCVQGIYPGPVWNKEATQNGFGPCGSSFHGNEKWHLLQQLWCNTNGQLSYNEKKQLHLVRRFEQFLRRLIRTRSHREMVIFTETDF